MQVVEIKSRAGLLAGSLKTYGLEDPLTDDGQSGNAEEEGV